MFVHYYRNYKFLGMQHNKDNKRNICLTVGYFLTQFEQSFETLFKENIFILFCLLSFRTFPNYYPSSHTELPFAFCRFLNQITADESLHLNNAFRHR